MKTAQKIEFLINKMGLTDLNFKDAGEGRKFESSQTRYKLYYTQDGGRRSLAFHPNWEKESAKFFALQAKAAKMFGSMPCATTEVRSAFMRTITTTCTKCGGYGIIHTFSYPELPKRNKVKTSSNR